MSWVFRNLDFTFSEGRHYAILGANGSGKSTLLQILCGMTLPSEGRIIYRNKEKEIEAGEIYRNVNFAAPYVGLFDQLNVDDVLRIHTKFKSFYRGLTSDEVLEKMNLTTHRHKSIDMFSSGMKQRLKLGLAIMSESDLLFLDEPLTNLDEAGQLWYLDLIREFQANRIIVVSSNHQEAEYRFCDHIYHL